ncbi:hypothetical protein E2C01_080913 [Portunus trituberculatus]|uniref:Uncharacterized protein n=1 Tax=Portunus trituberculatus TaxID=210409 RepID=A0A5B7IZM3_PORTR|nr:hypothetical protein [Portunus trituberculatus]
MQIREKEEITEIHNLVILVHIPTISAPHYASRAFTSPRLSPCHSRSRQEHATPPPLSVSISSFIYLFP